MKHLILLIFLFIAIASCGNTNQIAEIGKHLPDYTFYDVLNSEEDQISLKELKGKVVILEFWATWCGSCMPAMKKLDKLQDVFHENLEVLTVSYEERDRLLKYLDRSKTKLRIVSDSTHVDYFKYKTIPHSIVVDKKGIVRAITSPENIDSAVLGNLINNDIIDLELKDDFYFNPGLKTMAIASFANADQKIELKSYDQEKRGSSQILRDGEGNINGIKLQNLTIPQMYESLFDIASAKRIAFKDNLSQADFPYEQDYRFNLTIEVSHKHHDEWREIGIGFLNEHLGYYAKMGIDSLDCYVLKNSSNTIKRSNATESDYMFMGSIMKAEKIRIGQLAEYLENEHAYPVLDKTNLLEEYDFKLEWEAGDIQSLYDELMKYGLSVERSDEKLPVDVLEIYKRQ